MFGSSVVHFEGNRVLRWEDFQANLKAKLISKKNSNNVGYFTFGSTKDEVLAIQGQPTGVYESFWLFGSSVVHFEGNRVLRWEDFQANLKVKIK
jgi:hypothetical protein